MQIIFRKVADLKHEQELEEMQQHQPQPEFSQDHIVRRLIAKIRKPSDAGPISGAGSRPAGSSNTLQVPQQQLGLPTISGQLSSADSGTSSTGAPEGAAGAPTSGGPAASMVQKKQSRWSQMVASAAAGAAGSKQTKVLKVGGGGAGAGEQQDAAGLQQAADQSSSNRSSADGGRDDEVDENYFRPGGKGHQALLDNMDKR